MLAKFFCLIIFLSSNIIFCLDLKALKSKADRGNVNAQYEYARRLEEIGGETELIAARYYIKLAADKGHTSAPIFYGMMLYYGKGGRKDFILARHYFKISADQGDFQAQYLYGLMCLGGLGGEENLKDAKQYFLFAAMAGYMDAKKLYDGLFKRENNSITLFFEN